MNTNDIILTIIVPVYNVADYLEDCVISIQEQIWKHYELLLIDDGSTDGSGNLCDELSLNDKRISVIHKQNGGLSSARNVGIKNAKGRYLTFVDSDDYLDPEYLNIMMNELLDKNADMVMCDYVKTAENSHPKTVTQSISECDTGIISGKEFITKELTGRDCVEAVYQSKDHGINWLAWSKIYRAELFSKYDIEYPEGMINEDVAIAYKLIYYSKLVVYCDEALYYYRNRENSIMTSPFTEKRLEVINKTREACEFFIGNHENKLAAMAVNYHFRSAYTLLLKYMNSNVMDCEKSSVAKRLKRQLRKDVKIYSSITGLPVKKKIVYRLVSLFPTKFVLEQISF